MRVTDIRQNASYESARTQRTRVFLGMGMAGRWVGLALSAVFGATVLFGCVTDTQKADAGLFPENYRAMAKDYLRRTLFDPYSVRDAEIAAPTVQQSIHIIDPSPGWTICVRYNAKNRMGAYAGTTENALLVRGDRVTVSLHELTTPMPRIGMCRDAKWEPFQELGL